MTNGLHTLPSFPRLTDAADYEWDYPLLFNPFPTHRKTTQRRGQVGPARSCSAALNSQAPCVGGSSLSGASKCYATSTIFANNMRLDDHGSAFCNAASE